MKKILVVGGAGYVGSHTSYLLAKNGYKVTIVDNLSTGFEWAIRDADFVQCDIRDRTQLSKLFDSSSFDAVVHFAAKSIVSDSTSDPFDYYDNNVLGSLNLFRCAAEFNIKKLLFSSTAAVYGMNSDTFITEQSTPSPINPYGFSKYVVEKILEDAFGAYGISSVSLRYFNAAGSLPSASLGEAHEPETHLIPNIFRYSVMRSKPVKIFGNDYDTKDGTCIRDYVHVMDLAVGHMLALEWMNSNEGYERINLGSGVGYSVLEIIDACEKVAGQRIERIVERRRKGDPPNLVADVTKAKNILNWTPERGLSDIVCDAWAWHKNFHRS